MNVLLILLLMLLPSLATANDYYTHGSFPATGSAATSAGMRAELDLITAGFDKMPALTGNASRAVIVNGSGTALALTTGTLTLPGNFALSGANNVTLTSTGATNVTLPTTGTLSTLAGSEVLTTKSVDLANNTLTGTLAQFNTACSNCDFLSVAGTESPTGKTIDLTNNTLTGTLAQFNTACSNCDFASLAGAENLTNKTVTSGALVSPTLSGTPVFPDNVFTVGGSSDATKKVAFEVDGLTTATTRTVTIPDASGTLAYNTAASTTVAGLIEIATQAEVDAMTDTSRVVTPNHNKIIAGGSIATTSGTTRDITGVPAGVRRITGHLIGTSISGTNDVLLQIGDAGGLENTNYNGVQWQGTTGISLNNLSSSFILMSNPGAAAALYGHFTLDLADESTNTWTVTSSLATSGATTHTHGSKALSATLDRFSLLVSGANTFDNGTLYYTWER